MKKELLLSLSIIMMLMVVPFTAQAQTTYMSDGFENGFNPTGAALKTTAWTQEYYDASKSAWVTEAPKNSQPWKTETNSLQYPDGAVNGKGRAYFRNEPDANGTVQTAGYRTRLITPVMDLSKGYQPILRFYHAQAKYTGDFDTLRVYYRNGQGLQWHMLAEYTTRINKWTFEELTLSAVTDDYQIAFEANENIGRGIVLDSVVVRTRPQITVPHDLSFSDMRDNGITIHWQASMDADYFQVALTKNPDFDYNVQPDSINNKQVILNKQVDSEVLQLRVENLDPGATYYVQIRSLGATENSSWCNVKPFHMKVTMPVPYFENFNTRKDGVEKGSSILRDNQLSAWVYGGDYQPHVPIYLQDAGNKVISYDGTFALAFVKFGKYDATTAFNQDASYLPAGSTSYTVAPEMSSTKEGFNLNQCHVTFWGTIAQATGNYARSIIVGVMTDPEDLTTFVPVDTCTMWAYKTFQYFDINLASYVGDGRFVAFLSNFEKSNQFFIDDVTIAERPAVGAVQMTSIKVLADTTNATITWDAVAGATGYKVKVQKLEKKGAKTPILAKDITSEPQTVTTNSYTLTGITANAKYVVAVQAIDGEWSQPKAFYTSASILVDDTHEKYYSFEEDEGFFLMEGTDNTANEYPIDFMIFSNDPEHPYMYKTQVRTGKMSLGLTKDVGCDAWVVAPMVPDVKAVEVQFYTTTTSSGKLQVGVMTHPDDITTFVPVGEFTETENFTKRYANFLTYNGTGKYIAFRWVEVDGTIKSCNFIDDLTIRALGSCLPVTGISATATDTSAVITWNKGTASKWEVKVSSSIILDAELATKDGDILKTTAVTENTCSIDSLDWATTYYVYVRAMCDETTYSDWVGQAFTTDCPTVLKVPYKETFERFASGSGKIPACWSVAYPYTSTSYPNVYNGSYANNGSQSLYLYSNATSGGYISLPELNIPLSETMVRFYAKSGTSSSTTYELYVGVMTDPSDGDTFTPVDTISVVGNISSQFIQYMVLFNKYQGNGKYIAFSTVNGSINYFYLDDLEVMSVVDGAPLNFEAKEATENSITAQWEGKTTDQWKVIVSKTYYALKDSKDLPFNPDTIPAKDVVASDTVSTNEFKAEGLSVMTEYYFYVKSTKGTEWGMGSLMTACQSLNPRVKKTEGFEIGKTVISSLTATETEPGYFENAQVPTCWTVGNARYGTDLSVATTYTIRNYFPFICSNGTGTNTTNYYDQGTAKKSYAYSSAGYNSLKIYGSYSKTATSNYSPAWAAMPYLDCEDADLPLIVITGQLQMGTTKNALLVGVMDDPNDLSTFVVLDSITGGKGTGRGSNGTTDKVVSFEVSLEEYTGKGHYIAFRTPYGASTTVYLDEINVSLATCAAPSPSFSQITANSARLYSGLRIDNAWKYYLSTTPFNTKDMDAGIMPADSLILDSLVVGNGSMQVPYAPLSNLLPDTTYYVALATICDNTTSAWRTTSFKTLCQNVDIETFKEDFESKEYTANSGYPIGCWVIGNNTATAAVGYQPYVIAAPTFAENTSRMLRMVDNKNYGTGCYAVMPGFAFPDGKSIKDYQLCMTVAASGYTNKFGFGKAENGTLIVGVTTDPHNLNAMEAIDTIVYTTSTMEKLVLPLDTYTGNGNFVVLMSQAIDTTASWIFVDDISFEPIPACRNASHIEIDSVAQTAVTLSWEGEADKYNVAIATEKYEDSVKNATFVAANTDIVLTQVTGHSATVTGLKANTNYYAYVQALCSETEKSVWSYGASYFRTECPDLASIPWFDDFDDPYYPTGSGTMGYCYRGEYLVKGVINTSYPQIQTTATYSHEKQSLKLYGSSANTNVFVTPELDVTSLTELQLSFYAGKTKNNILYIGTIDSVEAMYNTFVPFDSVTLTASMEQYFINLDTVNLGTRADKKHIAFMANGKTGTAYIDDLRIRLKPTCYEPTDITISNVQTTQATLTFKPFNDTDTQWDVRLKDLDANTEKIYNLTDTSFTFTGLKHTNNYAVQLRTNCGEDQSEWTTELTFNTKWVIEDTYTFTFKKDEQGTTSVLSPKSTSTYIHPALTGLSGSNATSSYYPYYVFNSATYAYALNPEGDTKESALKFQVSQAYDSTTLVLPLIKDPDKKQITFYLRAGYAYTSTYTTNETNRNVVNTISKDAYIQVGTIDTLGNFESFKPYATIHPSQLVKNDTLRKADNYGWDKYTIPLAALNVKDQQVAFMMTCYNKKQATLYMGQLAIETLTDVASPVITEVIPADTTATISWIGNASAYNIYLIDTLKTTATLNFIPYLRSAADSIVTKIENVTGNTYTLKGLEEMGTYAVYVQDAAHADDQAALSSRVIFTTGCVIKEGNGYSYGFEPGPNFKAGKNPSVSVADGFTYQWPTSTTPGDTVYRTPDCWHVGIDVEDYDIATSTYKSYNPTLLLNTSTYRYSLSGIGAFRFYGSSKYKEVYAVMPAMEIDMDTTELVFYGRCFYEKANKVNSASYLKGASATNSQKLAVGTMTDPENISTFVPLDTVEYGYTNEMITTSTTVVNDTLGLRYFQKFTVPLTGAKGNYIAFRQVGIGYFYMDDVSTQKHQTPREPRDLELLEATTNSATVSWKPVEKGGTYTLQYMESKAAKNWNEATTISGITSTTYTIPNLQLAVKYVWRVCHVNAEISAGVTASSRYTFYETFQTECASYNPNGFSTSFEKTEDVESFSTTSDITKNKCWSYLNHGTSTTMSTYWAYNIPNGSSTFYSHSGESALKLYHSSTTYQTVAVTPELNAEIGVAGKGFDTLQVSFYMCPVSRNKTGVLSSSGKSYAKMIEVGTCTDPEDPTTYTVLDTCIYECDGNDIGSNKIKGTDANEYGFQKFSVKLNNATGPYVFFRANKNRTLEDGTVCTNSTMYVDDVVFETLQTCAAPFNTIVTDRTATSAKIAWSSEGAVTFDIEVSADATFKDSAKMVLSQKNITDSSVVLNNLKKETIYYYHIKSYCDASGKQASDWTTTEHFRTAYAPLFTESFTATDIYTEDNGWQAMKGYAKDIFAGGQLEANTTSSDYNSWYRLENNVINGAHLRMTFFYAGSAGKVTSTYQAETYLQKYWLVSPLITVEKAGTRLLFDAALSTYEYTVKTQNQPIQVNETWNTGWDDQFMIIVSEDGGNTWKRENAIIWNNETTNDESDPHYRYGIGDYKLTDIDYDMHKIGIDLSKYVGKTIKIAFYGENTEQNANCALHIDNIRVNQLVEEKQDLSMCQFQDIDDVFGFSIDGDTVSTGLKKYERYALSNNTDGTEADSLYTLTAEYLEAPIYNYEVVICDNTPFQYMGFNEHNAPGTYRMKLKSEVTGCDSIVNLTIKYTSKFETTIDTTICEGDYIEFDGKRIDEAGKYPFYYQAQRGACDSTVTLNVSVIATKYSTTSVTVCEGETYTFGNNVYDKSGVYVDSLKTASGCDSIATLSLTVLTNQHTTYTDSIYRGETYYWDGEWIAPAASTTLNSTRPDVNGCDSFATLNLLVKIMPITWYNGTAGVSICQGDNCQMNGKSYTSAGTYYDTTWVNMNGRLRMTRIDGLVLNVLKPSYKNLTESICEGEEYVLNNKICTKTGVYRDTLKNSNGCDSIITLNLTVNPVSHTSFTENIWHGELYHWAGKTLSESCKVDSTLKNIYGCDSIVTLNLEVTYKPVVWQNVTTCQYEALEFGGKSINTDVAGEYEYYDTIRVYGVADSISGLHLTVNKVDKVNLTASICKGETYTFGGKEYDKTGYYSDSLTNRNGCDSIVILQLMVGEPLYSTFTDSIWHGELYQWAGQTLTESCEVDSTLKNIQGCDSIIVTLNLVVTYKPVVWQDAVICEGEVYEFGGKPIAIAGTYYDTIRVPGVADSISGLHLTVNKVDRKNIQASICKGETYQFGNRVCDKTDIYIDTLTNHNGCDSIVTLLLTVSEALHTSFTDSIWHGESYQWAGQTLTESCKVDTTLKSEATGCDSIVTLSLVVMYKPVVWQDAQICEGDAYQFGDTLLTVAGTYYDTVRVAGSADVINGLHLMVNKAETRTIRATICEGDTYPFGNSVYNKSGFYTDSLKTINGCDSVVTLVLRVLPQKHVTITDSILHGESYQWAGQTLTESAVIDSTFKAVNDCDSIVTLNLVVKYADVNYEYRSICEGDSSLFGGKFYNAAGTYYDTVRVAGQADEINGLVLSINDVEYSTITESICEGDAYSFAGRQLTEMGLYTDTLTNRNGCDSIVTLMLTVSSQSHTYITDSILHGELYPWAGQMLSESCKVDSTFKNVNYCDSIVTLSLVVTYTPVVWKDAAICQGDAYPFGDKLLTVAGTYYDTVRVAGTADVINGLHLTVNKPDKVNITKSICYGETCIFGNNVYDKTGVYSDTLVNRNGCDSIVTLMLLVLPQPHTYITDSILHGELYQWAGQTLTESCMVDSILKSEVTGCDSIVTLNLMVTYAPVVWQETAICQGDAYQFGDKLLTVAGTYYDTVRVAGVADVINGLHLKVKKVNKVNITETICEGEPYPFGDNVYNKTGVYSDTLVNRNGCDSIVTLMLTVLPKSYTTITDTILHGELYQWAGQTLTESTKIDSILKDVNGCDSIVTLNLVVTYAPVVWQDTAICEGETIEFGGNLYNAEGLYYDTIRVAGVADVINGLRLVLNKPDKVTITASICEGDTYPFAGQILTKADMYSDTLVNRNGCDSIVTLILTVLPQSHTTITESIIHGDTYQWAGQTLTETTRLDSIFVAANGCDSIVTLNLIVNDPVIEYQYASICKGSTYEFGGKSYDAMGTYYDTIRVNGKIQSIKGLVLTVNNPEYSDITASICAGDTYTFGEQQLTEAGAYTNTFTNRNGCDSIVNLMLTVLQSSTRKVAEQICQGDTYDFFGRVLTEAGTYADTAHYVSGCDSIITILTLTVAEPTTSEYSVSICQGGSYIFGDTIITTAGDYTRTITNRAGCDSIITLHLSLNEPLRGAKYATFTKGCSYTYNGVTYTEAGEYEVDVQKTENGCDSIITLYLTEAEQGRDTIWATICTGEYYVDENFNTNIPGTHEVEVTMGECSIIRTLILENTDNSLTQQAAICSGDTYEFYGQTLNTTGAYTYTLAGQGEECDTIVTLNLMVLSGDTIYVKDSLTTAELPYLYNGQVVLPLGTEVGTYQDTLQVSSASGECSQIVVLTIIVRQPDAVDNVGFTTLNIRPTAVSRNEIVYIDNDFTASQRAEMTIDMYDMLGHRMDVNIPETGVITISNFPCAGVYTIRITTSEQVFIGRVIVKN